jgi:AraC family transcriptional regulator
MEDMNQSQIYKEFLSMTNGTDLFYGLINSFPHPIQVYAPDGVLVLVNPEFIKEFHIEEPEAIIGKYNLLHDPTLSQYGALPNVKSAFSGKVMYASDFKVPVHAVKKTLNIPIDEIKAKFSDILTIPIMNPAGELQCIVNILMTKRTSTGREEINTAIQFIEEHWLEEFNIEALSEAVHLSPAHFSRLFKEHTGKAPREYYTYYKLQRLKDKLIDGNLSVSQAFEACGLNYHSYYAKLFKAQTGYSPTEYRINANK